MFLLSKFEFGIAGYLRSEKLTPRLLWQQVEHRIVPSASGYIVFDDSVLDKRYASKIELARTQYSGNEHGVVQGIGLVSCVYVNVSRSEFWVIDYRLYDPQRDGKSKLDHVADMLDNLIEYKRVPFATVLMDAWYATQELMAKIDHIEKIYYCPLKVNRKVDDSQGQQPYNRVDELEWSEADLAHGKTIKIRNFPKDKKVKLFRVTVSTSRTDYIVTNDISQNSTDETQKASAVRWRVEEFHREVKQLTGIEACQCRKARIQRNHIACSLLVWSRLKAIASCTDQTIYQVKAGLLRNYLIGQLKQPDIRMTFV
ncbi:transposase [Myxacorys almedinensis A]|uniref:Transposase n=1 Tax=Myxacorys almedinensis A TaxID=2690445 RepID=A0A8J8CMC0_9CYAN|nr:transposase [Myxacorys almedinensis A]